MGRRLNGLMVNWLLSIPIVMYEPASRAARSLYEPPRSKMTVCGSYFWACSKRKLQVNDLPLPVIPEMSVWGTSW